MKKDLYDNLIVWMPLKYHASPIKEGLSWYKFYDSTGADNSNEAFDERFFKEEKFDPGDEGYHFQINPIKNTFIDYTMSFFLEIKNLNDPIDNYIINEGVNDYIFSLLFKHNNKNIELRQGDYSENGIILNEGPQIYSNVLKEGEHHYTIIRKNDKYELYIDGKKIEPDNRITTQANSNLSQLTILNSSFKGTLRDFRLFDISLNDNDIQKLYTRHPSILSYQNEDNRIIVSEENQYYEFENVGQFESQIMNDAIYVENSLNKLYIQGNTNGRLMFNDKFINYDYTNINILAFTKQTKFLFLNNYDPSSDQDIEKMKNDLNSLENDDLFILTQNQTWYQYKNKFKDFLEFFVSTKFIDKIPEGGTNYNTSFYLLQKKGEIESFNYDINDSIITFQYLNKYIDSVHFNKIFHFNSQNKIEDKILLYESNIINRFVDGIYFYLFADNDELYKENEIEVVIESYDIDATNEVITKTGETSKINKIINSIPIQRFEDWGLPDYDEYKIKIYYLNNNKTDKGKIEIQNITNKIDTHKGSYSFCVTTPKNKIKDYDEWTISFWYKGYFSFDFGQFYIFYYNPVSEYINCNFKNGDGVFDFQQERILFGVNHDYRKTTHYHNVVFTYKNGVFRSYLDGNLQKEINIIINKKYYKKFIRFNHKSIIQNFIQLNKQINQKDILMNYNKTFRNININKNLDNQDNLYIYQNIFEKRESIDKPTKNSIIFDSFNTKDNIFLKQIKLNNNGSIQIWVKLKNTVYNEESYGKNIFRFIINDNKTYKYMQLYYSAYTQSIFFKSDNRIEGEYNYQSKDINVYNDYNWHFYVVSWDNGKIYIYKDQILQYELINNLQINKNQLFQYEIGTTSNKNEFLEAKYSLPLIFNSNLTQEDITELYNEKDF